jgi:hypothetical protein
MHTSFTPVFTRNQLNVIILENFFGSFILAYNLHFFMWFFHTRKYFFTRSG